MERDVSFSLHLSIVWPHTEDAEASSPFVFLVSLLLVRGDVLGPRGVSGCQRETPPPPRPGKT